MSALGLACLQLAVSLAGLHALPPPEPEKAAAPPPPPVERGQSLEERGDSMLFEISALSGTPFDQAVTAPFD